MTGWFKLHRRILESKQFGNPLDLKVWIWLLCKASTKRRNMTLKVGNGFQVVTLETGQMIFGRATAENELQIDGSTVYKIVQRLAQDGSISIESNNRFSIITITQYIEHQSGERIEDFEILEDVTTPEQQKNSKVTTAEQLRDNCVTQLKKVNKVKNVKKVEKVGPAPALIVSDEFKRFREWVETNAPRVATMKEPFTEDQFLRAKKEWATDQITDILKKMHNWEPLIRKNRSAYLTLNNWLKKDHNNGTTKNQPTHPGGNGHLGTSGTRTEALRNW